MCVMYNTAKIKYLLQVKCKLDLKGSLTHTHTHTHTTQSLNYAGTWYKPPV